MDEDEELNVLRIKILLIDGEASAQFIRGSLKPGWAFTQRDKYFYFREQCYRTFYETERECLEDGLKLLLSGAAKLEIPIHIFA